jgi:hypothetical protein
MPAVAWILPPVPLAPDPPAAATQASDAVVPDRAINPVKKPF